ncbi:hypothetical protein ANN_26865 [Periplaneta americana]|uniref:Uncharacterized protein n=1 Tax=Periplaneta americana TaxID=6978 RepID=A0ABQ8RZE2_PERAM|nr:hypothetical protein ANN_26865 [Periplaneta americana]
MTSRGSIADSLAACLLAYLSSAQLRKVLEVGSYDMIMFKGGNRFLMVARQCGEQNGERYYLFDFTEPLLSKTLITKEGILLVDIMPHGTTINSDTYVANLKKLQARLSLLTTSGEAGCSAIARQRTAICQSQDHRPGQKIRIDNTETSALQSELAPCDYHLCGKLKDPFAERDDSLAQAAKEWLRCVGPDFYRAGLQALDTKLLQNAVPESYDCTFDTNSEILFVKWDDNRCVHVGSKCDVGASASRWDRNISDNPVFRDLRIPLHAVTVYYIVDCDAVAYIDMQQNFLFPEMKKMEMELQIIFQQGGTPSHFVNHVREELNHRFPDRWNGRNS